MSTYLRNNKENRIKVSKYIEDGCPWNTQNFDGVTIVKVYAYYKTYRLSRPFSKWFLNTYN